MKKFKETLEGFELPYKFEESIKEEELLFFDIETTGFTAQSSNLYLIGMAYKTENGFVIEQLFAQNPSEESEIITEFFNIAKNYRYLVHFNGNHFDLPYVSHKCEQLGLPYNFDNFLGIDIYKRISSYKYFLKLPNCKQKTIEHFLGIGREDIYTGGELISIYKDYVKNPSEEAFRLLVLHNLEDVKGMLQIVSILAYYDLFNGQLRAKKVQINSYTDMNGIVQKELLMKLHLPSTLPVATSFMSHNCYFSGNEDNATIKVPLYEEELKYFYTNYKDYYYLPEEDLAIHKSVATFVDKDCRQKASAANCYTRKQSTYLPQWNIVFEPFFKRDYESKELYFELTDDLKADRAAFSNYAKHILDMMLHNY